MKTRKEVLRCARDLAEAVGESVEIQELQRCEAALGELAAEDLVGHAEDPRVIAYVQAKDRAERLIHQVTSVFLFPLTGSLQPARAAAGAGCAGCSR